MPVVKVAEFAEGDSSNPALQTRKGAAILWWEICSLHCGCTSRWCTPCQRPSS